MKIVTWLSIVFISLAGSMAWAQSTVPAVPTTPAAIESILYARAFTLEKGYRGEWGNDKPMVREGAILVLKVNPDLVYPRQSAEPVLFVGNRPAERVNTGYPSGHVIAIVPGKVDLTQEPIWFGTPELPERVDQDRSATERALAEAAGIKPFSAGAVQTSLASGGAGLSLSNRNALRPFFASLLQQFSPQEKDLINMFNVPVAQ